jgi:hypothetical protein
MTSARPNHSSVIKLRFDRSYARLNRWQTHRLRKSFDTEKRNDLRQRRLANFKIANLTSLLMQTLHCR